MARHTMLGVKNKVSGVSLPIRANGMISGTGVIQTSEGIDSATYVTTGSVRINFTTPYLADNTYMGLCTGIQATSGTLGWWTRVAYLKAAYMEITTRYGYEWIHNPNNPTYIYFEAREPV